MQNSVQAKLVGRVRRYFSEVNRVADSTRAIKITVTRADCKLGSKKDAKACAMAVACKRQLGVDGALIRPTVAYIIKGDLAVKYEVPASVRTEIVSFDRHKDFRPGEYQLSAVYKCHSVHAKRGGGTVKESRGIHVHRRPLVSHVSDGMRGLTPD